VVTAADCTVCCVSLDWAKWDSAWSGTESMDLRQYLPVIAGLSEMQMIRLPSNGTVTKALAVRNPPLAPQLSY